MVFTVHTFFLKQCILVKYSKTCGFEQNQATILTMLVVFGDIYTFAIATFHHSSCWIDYAPSIMWSDNPANCEPNSNDACVLICLKPVGMPSLIFSNKACLVCTSTAKWVSSHSSFGTICWILVRRPYPKIDIWK